MKIILTKAKLIKLYRTHNITTLTKILKVSAPTIYRALDKYGIEKKGHKRPYKLEII